MKPLFLSLIAAVALSACDKPAEPPVTPPDENGIPTHVPRLAPQVEALQRAAKVDGVVQDSAQETRDAVDAATQ